MKKTIAQRFADFHEANPNVWMLFELYALEATRSGRRHYGIAAITERIRWHINIETKGDEFKLNNNWKAYYARMFMNKYPEHQGFFNTRRLNEAKGQEPLFLSSHTSVPEMRA